LSKKSKELSTKLYYARNSTNHPRGK
jgi:hypothetical protein